MSVTCAVVEEEIKKRNTWGSRVNEDPILEEKSTGGDVH